ncbi:MAG TPA: multidrug efflux SMR transporter [Candidatus Sphingobacterium stercoripullorum]|nr:multidrug efflux SMR transporter [Candidatus Sphingobacterium stercoripullorum]
MNWIILIIAGLFEVGFTLCLGKAKNATGNAMYLWYFGFLITITVSMLLLIKATQSLPLGTAYAVWTGIGAVGTVLVGILLFKEPVTILRLLFIVTLIGSIVGLKAVSS